MSGEAIDRVKRCPNPMSGPSVIEIRELYETETSSGPSEIVPTPVAKRGDHRR